MILFITLGDFQSTSSNSNKHFGTSYVSILIGLILGGIYSFEEQETEKIDLLKKENIPSSSPKRRDLFIRPSPLDKISSPPIDHRYSLIHLSDSQQPQSEVLLLPA